jgi:hypothetical protein
MSNQVLALSPKRLEEFLTHLVNLQGDQDSINRFLKRFADFRLFNRRLLRALTGREYQIRDAKPKFMIGVDDQEIWRSNDGTEYVIDTSGLFVDDQGDVVGGSGNLSTVDAAELVATVKRSVIPYVYENFRAVWSEPDVKTRMWCWACFRTQLAGFWHPTRRGGSVSDATYFSFSGEGIKVRPPHPPELIPIEQAFEYLLTHHSQTRYCRNGECPAPYFFTKRHTQRYCSESCAQSGERETKRRWWAEQGSALRKKQTQSKAISKLGRKASRKGRKGK